MLQQKYFPILSNDNENSAQTMASFVRHVEWPLQLPRYRHTCNHEILNIHSLDDYYIRSDIHQLSVMRQYKKKIGHKKKFFFSEIWFEFIHSLNVNLVHQLILL